MMGGVAACGSSSSDAPTETSGYTAGMTAAVKAASEAAVKLTTFDFRQLDAYYATLAKLGSTSFQQDLQATRADTVAFDQANKVISEGTLVDAAAKDETADGSVTVLVFVDQRLRSLGATSGELKQPRMQLVMKQSGGRWIVDQVTVSGNS